MKKVNLPGHNKGIPHEGGSPEVTSMGRGGGRFGRGTGRLGVSRSSTLQPRQRFEGDIQDLQGKTYELVGNKSADLYTETTKHIASYVAIKCQHGGDIRRVVETRARPMMTAPNRTAIATQLGIPETTIVGEGDAARIVLDPLVQMMFAEEVKEHVKRTRKLEENIKFLWTVLWAQSSQAVRNRLEALNTYETMKQESDGLELLIAIKDLLYNVQDRKYVPLSIHLAKRQFYLNSQGRSTSVAAYYEQFNNIIDMMEHCGASLGEDDGIITKVLEHNDIDPTAATATQKENARIEAQEWYYGLAFLMGADRVRFGRYLEDLENDFTQGVDRYPKSRVDAHHVLANWKQDPRNLVRLTGGNDGVQFTNMALNEQDMMTQQQQDDIQEAHDNIQEPNDNTSETEGTTLTTVTTKAPTTNTTSRGGRYGGRGGGRGRGHGRNVITCFRCGQRGHYASECDATSEEVEQYRGTKVQTTRHDSGEQLLHSGVLQDDPDLDNDITTSWAFHQVHMVHDQAHLETRHGGRLPLEWVLLDNQSTIDVFVNRRLLKNIRRIKQYMYIHCTAGVTRTNLVGELPGYGTVWFHPDGIANILSLARVKTKYRITFDSDESNEFIVHKPDGTTRNFKESSRGLYYHDTSIAVTEVARTGSVLVTTVADNASNYTHTNYSRALLARKTQQIIGRPSVRDYIRYVENNLIPNCPITRQDILTAEHIFGPDVGSLKGKTSRRQPRGVGLYNHTQIPPGVVDQYRDVIIAVDVLYVNKLPFIATISRYIRFGTVEFLRNQKSTTLTQHVKQVNRLYRQCGFRPIYALMDGQFEPLRGDLADMGIQLNTVSNDEHVPEIERQIRTLKERTRAIYCTLPFRKIPHRVIIEMVYAANYWLNMFPRKGGISQTMSPRTLLTGLTMNYNRHCRLEFGEYVQTHEEHDNSLNPRTIGALALRPTGNVQGGYFFFSLTTGKVINRMRWTSIPMPKDVIDRVERMARQEHAGTTLLFEDRDHNAIVDVDDDDDDSEYEPKDDDDNDDDNGDDDDNNAPTNQPNEPYDDPGILGAEHDQQHPDEENNNENNENNNENDVVDENNNNYNNENTNENDDMQGEDGQTRLSNENDIVPENVNSAAMDDNPGGTTGVDPMPLPPIQVQNERTQRELNRIAWMGQQPVTFAGRTRAQAKQHGITNVMTTHNNNTMTDFERDLFNRRVTGIQLPAEYEDQLATLKHTVLTQYTLKKGLQVFGPKGTEAVFSEMKQLHDRKVCEPVHRKDLSSGQRNKALGYLMFLKQKRCGRIKGRGCADGRKQRVWTTKEDATSPTVSTEAVLLTAVIDAKERREVITVDIPGAFMQGDQDETVHMKLEGTLADLLARCDPTKYQPYLTTENGKTVLYVELVKALYGTIRAALIFWRKFTKQITKWGFTVNPYDWCVANKMVQGSQLTITWHVDDLKISHVNKAVLEDLLKQLNGAFGKDGPLTIHRGKKHDYLGMWLDFSLDGKVQVQMFEYIDNMLADLPEDMCGTVNSPAADHLFTVNETGKKLPRDQAELFHHNVAKLLFLCKRARPDIQTAVAFLTTRVMAPDEDDYKKLARVMKYLRGTRAMPLTLEADNLQVIKWWIDGAFATHQDMRSHTGGALSLGKGVITGVSTRQKLTTRSSTEAELVAVDDCMSLILWTRYFLEAQGYGVDDAIIYQDNKSAILLEQNGRASSTRRTRHLNIRYFFVTDRIKKNEVHIRYCPTHNMLADYFTKPLQGAAFRKFRDAIMNYDLVRSDVHPSDHRSVLDHERANEQSHAIAVRLKANHGQTESEGKKDLIQAKRNRFE